MYILCLDPHATLHRVSSPFVARAFLLCAFGFIMHWLLAFKCFALSTACVTTLLEGISSINTSHYAICILTVKSPRLATNTGNGTLKFHIPKPEGCLKIAWPGSKNTSSRKYRLTISFFISTVLYKAAKECTHQHMQKFSNNIYCRNLQSICNESRWDQSFSLNINEPYH